MKHINKKKNNYHREIDRENIYLGNKKRCNDHKSNDCNCQDVVVNVPIGIQSNGSRTLTPRLGASDGDSMLISFSSGGPQTITANSNGLPVDTLAICSGTSFIIKDTDVSEIQEDFNAAFSMPFDGTVTSIEGVINPIAWTLQSSFFIRLQLYISLGPNNALFPLDFGFSQVNVDGEFLTTDTLIRFPQNRQELNFPVNKGDRILLLFLIYSAGFADFSVLISTVSASIVVKRR